MPKKNDIIKYFLWGSLFGAVGTALLYGPIKRLLKKETGKAMREIVERTKSHPQIRKLVAILIKNVPSWDVIGQIRTIFRFVADRIRYMRDPFKKEHLANPLETLQVQAGDCDCKSILLATLLETCGFETQFVLVPQHVFVNVRISAADANRLPDDVYCIEDVEEKKYWVPLESTAKGAPIGWMSENTYQRLVKGNAKFA